MKKLLLSFLSIILSFIEKSILFINRIIHSNKFVTYFLMRTYYAKLLEESFQTNKSKGLIIVKHQLFESIQNVYFLTKFNERMVFELYIKASFLVKKHSEDLINSQGKEHHCKCNSGKKFKNCCRKKYKL